MPPSTTDAAVSPADVTVSPGERTPVPPRPRQRTGRGVEVAPPQAPYRDVVARYPATFVLMIRVKATPVSTVRRYRHHGVRGRPGRAAERGRRTGGQRRRRAQTEGSLAALGVVDPDAHDALFQPRADDVPRIGGRVTLVYSDCRITVDNGEYLSLELLESYVHDASGPDPNRRRIR